MSVDEITIVDNQSWISLYAHVMCAWKRIFILVTFQHVVEGGNTNNLIVVVALALM